MAGRYKVGAKEARTADGITFDSVREKDAYLGFSILEKHRAIAKLELQVKFPLWAAQPQKDGSWKPVQFGTWTCDFLVTELDGTVRIYDSKGARTREFIRAKKIWEINYPDLRIVEV